MQIQTQIESFKEWQSSLWPSNFQTHYVSVAWQPNDSFHQFGFPSRERQTGLRNRFINTGTSSIGKVRSIIFHTLTLLPLWNNKFPPTGKPCPLLRSHRAIMCFQLVIVHTWYWSNSDLSCFVLLSYHKQKTQTKVNVYLLPSSQIYLCAIEQHVLKPFKAPMSHTVILMMCSIITTSFIVLVIAVTHTSPCCCKYSEMGPIRPRKQYLVNSLLAPSQQSLLKIPGVQIYFQYSLYPKEMWILIQNPMKVFCTSVIQFLLLFLSFKYFNWNYFLI